MTNAWGDWEGQVVNGEFHLQKYLGGSEQSGVFLTQLPGQQPQQAAIKLIRADTANAEFRLLRWEMAKSLSHPNLIRLYRSGRCQLGAINLIFVVMEYAEENLGQIIPERPLTPAEAQEMLDPTLDALAYLHGQGLVHGRLNPANIMALNDRLKLASDHIYRAGDSIPGPQEPDVYTPPESRNEIASPAADVWSLGITLAEVLTQHPPSWDEKDGADPLLPAGLPAPFLEIVRGCLSRDPASRWTIADINAHLHPPSPLPQKPVAQPPGVTKPLPQKPVTQQPIAVRPRVTMLAIVAAIVVAVRRAGLAIARGRRTMPAMVAAIVVAVLLAGWGLFHRSSNQGKNRQTVSPIPEEQKPNPSAGVAPVTSGSKSKPSPASSARSAKPSSPQPAAPPTTPNQSSAQNQVIHQVLPYVPQTARDTILGTIRVSIKVQVDPSGSVAESEFDSPGPSKYFARLAMEAAQGWKFVPDAQAASREFILRFEFTNAETKASGARISH